jgi:hypothetical protein
LSWKKNFQKSDEELARDELFSHIHRCGVLDATGDQQEEWLNDTIEYLAGRYPAMSERQLAELREIGKRFCSPVIGHGASDTALDGDEDAATHDEDEARDEEPALA